MLGIVVSRADEASVAIGESLRRVAEWRTETDGSRPDAAGGGTVYRTDGAVIREFEDRHLDLTRPADVFDAVDLDLLAFASKHAGETGRLLTAHHTGNFGPADHGGADNALARACPSAHARVLDAMAEYAPEGYEVGMECTHHGPTEVGAPSLFVEVGSGPDQWADRAAARAVARAILDLRGVEPDRPTSVEGDAATRRHLVGFGGGHYAPRFERITRETDWAVGHLAADWGLDAMPAPDTPQGKDLIDAAFQQSAATYGLVAGDRPALREAVDELGYRPVGETWVRQTDGVALELVRHLEAELTTVDEGLRFGAATAEPESVQITALSSALVETASGIDPDATRDVIEGVTIAYETDHGGTRPTGAMALADDADLEQLFDGLADVLRDRYDEVDREADELVARESVFDPDKARTLGVPEGPAFGRLSAGEAVEVDGRTIPPEQVRDRRTDRFTLR